ncbi:hypothetical protein K7X08_017157 [Anisodus acutangulus]|uniref:Uncharacterized protein n=1 Tax=Anisodus acutangulus TaxID=402998 RepID=A0A9Q1LQF2_9SOLA|nr:hypothetical protein K7X08_017157 [Anisodus acutangulus]
MEGRNKVAAADLGGNVLTGTLGNPLGLLARQLSYTLHKVRDECPLYHADGNSVDKDLDKKLEAAYNRLLDKASKSGKRFLRKFLLEHRSITTTRIFTSEEVKIPYHKPVEVPNSYSPEA